MSGKKDTTTSLYCSYVIAAGQRADEEAEDSGPTIHSAYKNLAARGHTDLPLPSPDHIPAEPGEYLGVSAGRLAGIRGTIITAIRDPDSDGWVTSYWFDPLMLIPGKRFIYSPEHSERFDPPSKHHSSARFWVQIQAVEV